MDVEPIRAKLQQPLVEEVVQLHAPRKLFFWCRVAPPEGGETPICDFAAVYDGLNPDIRREFEDKGITT
ncbi:TauD/TfdA family dioxygenase, partial [Stigmatella aurantiaca]|uniref:TauD/TfdA family dioxygenase n=1 Tax=Stigmatella aurantiaca TaxID=41 RepID=UPI001E2931CB